MLDGAPLLLLHDGGGGHRHRHDGQDQGHDAGDHEVHTLEVGVEPDPDRRVHGQGGGCLGAQALHQDARGLGVHDLRRVALGHGGGVGVGPVEQELDRDRFLAGEHGGEAGRNHEADPDLPGVHQGLDLSIVRGGVADVEVARSREPIDEGPAFRRPVQVADRRTQVLDVRGDGVAEDDELEDGHDDQDGQDTPVPTDLDEFLLHECPKAARPVRAHLSPHPSRF